MSARTRPYPTKRARCESGLLALVATGTLFSIYLTLLEPFVIGAACPWCLASAILMTLLLWLALRTGRLAPAETPGLSPI